MKIPVSELKKDSSIIEIKAKAEDFPELTEIGMQGRMVLTAGITPVGEKFWVSGQIVGKIVQECPKCTGPLLCEFSVPLKILMEFAHIKTIEWEGDEELNFDEYAVKIGLNTQEIPILDPIREQVLLNCNVTNPGETMIVPKCKNCLPIHNPNFLNKSETNLDPRWEKLKDLL